MKVLLDENFPALLAQDFGSHSVSHVIALGWQGTRNGDLLRKAEAAGFDVLVTFDTALPAQQNLSHRAISILVVRPKGQGVVATRTVLPQILVALENIGRGEFIMVSNR